MEKTQTVQTPKGFVQLLASGQFAKAERLMLNSPNMRRVLLNLPGVTNTYFFKKRIKFYRQYARANGMVAKLREDDRQTLRSEFAQSHCMVTTLKKACSKISVTDMLEAQYQRRLRLMKLRRRLGL